MQELCGKLCEDLVRCLASTISSTTLGQHGVRCRQHLASCSLLHICCGVIPLCMVTLVAGFHMPLLKMNQRWHGSYDKQVPLDSGKLFSHGNDSIHFLGKPEAVQTSLNPESWAPFQLCQGTPKPSLMAADKLAFA